MYIYVQSNVFVYIQYINTSIHHTEKDIWGSLTYTEICINSLVCKKNSHMKFYTRISKIVHDYLQILKVLK